MFFGINGWEFLVLALLAVLILGPERLPEYAQKLAHLIRRLRVQAEGAKDQLRDQLGPEYSDINWRQYDPRQYDPRRIVREALTEPLADLTKPFTDSVREVTKGESGVNEEPPGDPGRPPGDRETSTPVPAGRAYTPFDNDAT